MKNGYEKNHYLRLLDGQKWCADNPSHPSPSEVLKRLEDVSKKWRDDALTGKSPCEAAYGFERGKMDEHGILKGGTDELLASPQQLDAERSAALQECEERLTKSLRAIFRTKGSASVGRGFARGYGNKGPKDIQIQKLGEAHFLTEGRVREMLLKLGVDVRDAIPDELRSAASGAMPVAEPKAPTWAAGGMMLPEKWEQMVKLLQLMRPTDENLYKFLSAEQDETPGVIQEKLKKKRALFARVGKENKPIDKLDAEWETKPAPGGGTMVVAVRLYQIATVGPQLCGIAEGWFADEAKKAFYDALLRLEQGGTLRFLWEILPEWTDIVDGQRVISDELWEEAVRRVARNGNTAEAEWLVWNELCGKGRGNPRTECKRLPPDISALLGEAMLHLAAGRFDEALATLKRAETKSPKNPEIERLKSQAKEGKRKVQEAAEKVSAAERGISAALAGEDYEEAQKRVDAARNLPGFQAGPWEDRIERGKTKKAYEEAKTQGDWPSAETLGKKRAALGDGTEAEWKADIEKEKGNRRSKLIGRCRDALTAFDKEAAGNRYAQAKEAMGRAKGARDALEKDYPGSKEALEAKSGVDRRASTWAGMEERHKLEDLGGAEDVKAEGSDGGKPTVMVTWRAGSTGGTVERWCVKRKGGGTVEVVGETTGTGLPDSTAKAGVEYRYTVAPMAKIGTEWKANPDKEVTSAPTVCLAAVTWESKQGLGEPGGIAAVTLKWQLPGTTGAAVPGLSLEVVRTPAFPDGKPKTLSGGATGWTDKDVSVGASYRYSVGFVYAAKAKPRRGPVAESGPVLVKAVEPPPPVEELKVCRLKDREFEATWKWKGDATKAAWRVEPTGASGEEERQGGAESARMTLYSHAGHATLFVRALCSAGEVTRKAVREAQAAFGEPTVVTCVLQRPSWRNRRKGQCVLRLLSSDGALPQTTVRIGRTSEPQFIAEGSELGSPVPVPGKKGEAELEIPHGTKGYLHVFLLPPATEEEWQIVQPDDNQVG